VERVAHGHQPDAVLLRLADRERHGRVTCEDTEAVSGVEQRHGPAVHDRLGLLTQRHGPTGDPLEIHRHQHQPVRADAALVGLHQGGGHSLRRVVGKARGPEQHAGGVDQPRRGEPGHSASSSC